jgi:hypothetical protein
VPPTESVGNNTPPTSDNLTDDPDFTDGLEDAGLEDEETEGLYDDLDPVPKRGVGRFDPIVGWLVCVEGPHKGKDYRLRAGRNSIGRDETNRIAITADKSVSRNEHAIVSYDPRGRQFKMIMSKGTNLVYLNGESVDVSSKLNGGDTLELGKTKLRFVPFCGPDFDWQ